MHTCFAVHTIYGSDSSLCTSQVKGIHMFQLEFEHILRVSVHLGEYLQCQHIIRWCAVRWSSCWGNSAAYQSGLHARDLTGTDGGKYNCFVFHVKTLQCSTWWPRGLEMSFYWRSRLQGQSLEALFNRTNLDTSHYNTMEKSSARMHLPFPVNLQFTPTVRILRLESLYSE